MAERPPEILEFIRLFNSGKYFESHEVLEGLWLKTTGKEKMFYHGLIQLAVALAHHIRKNPEGAKRSFLNSKRKLQKYFPRHQGITVREIVVKTESCLFESDNPPVIL